MKTTLAALAVCAAAGMAQADVIAYWAFPEPTQSPNYTIAWPVASDLGSGTLDTDAPKYDGTPSPNALSQGSMQFFAGSAVNAQPGFAAGQALSLRNDTLDRGQGKSIFLTIDAGNYKDLVLSYAERFTSTGPQQVEVRYSADGVNFTSFTTYATNRSGAFEPNARVIDLSTVSGIEFNSAVILAITFNQFNANSSGAARLDNITVEGTFVPAPGSLALLGLGGLASFRGARRRR